MFNPQTIEQSKKPQKMTNFLGIETILQQPSSDEQKLDQIIKKLNKTGSLSRVNVFNSTSENLTYRQKATSSSQSVSRIINPTVEHEQQQHDHQKDSKELKVQFVLDCGLKDMDSTSVKKLLPTSSSSFVSLKKVPIQNPSYPSSVFNQRITTKNPTRLTYTQQGNVYFIPTKQPVKVATTSKPRIKNVYVDPPLVGEISDTFENVYNYFENAMTTKVKVKPRNKNIKKRPIKRSTVGNSITPPTFAPYHQYTPSYGAENGQKLTTNIQVTSEYVGRDPVTKKPLEGQADTSYESASYSDDSESSDDDYEDDNRDNDDDEDNEDDYYDFSLGGAIGGGDDVSVQFEGVHKLNSFQDYHKLKKKNYLFSVLIDVLKYRINLEMVIFL